MSQSLTNTNHFITLDQAVEMTTTYREQMNTILKEEYQGKNILVRSETFDRAPFETLLGKPGCAGLRVYYGMDSDLKIHAIIVGVDGDNKDILPDAGSTASRDENTSATGENTDPTEEDIVEMGIRCPNECPPPSPLNP